MLCGYYAILATLDGKITDFDNAACAIGVAYLFDAMDGRIARAMHTESAFGREFDSLADVVSFGIAPAFLAYAWGIRALAAANSSGVAAFDAARLAGRVHFCGLLRVAACAFQYSRHGAGRQSLFRGNAHSGGRGHDRRDGAFLPRAARSRTIAHRLSGWPCWFCSAY